MKFIGEEVAMLLSYMYVCIPCVRIVGQSKTGWDRIGYGYNRDGNVGYVHSDGVDIDIP